MADLPFVDYGSSLEEQQRGKRSGFVQCCSRFDVWLQNTSERIVNNILWKSLIHISTIILLFGPPTLILMPNTATDVATITLDVLYFLGFGIFAMDMIFRSYFDPNYFPCGPCHLMNRRGGRRKLYTQHFLGSFSFWCDFVSTVCFIFEISVLPFYEHFRYDDDSIVIELTQAGFPTTKNFQEVTSITDSYFTRSDVPFLLLMLKTARVARLIPTTTVLNTTERLLSLLTFWQPIVDRHENAKRVRKEITHRSSWGGLAIATQAHTEATAAHEQKVKKKGAIVFIWYRIKIWTESTLRYLRILPERDLYLNRQIAATRIQRAWRNRQANCMDTRSDKLETSQAWSGHPSASLHVSSLSRSKARSSRKPLFETKIDAKDAAKTETGTGNGKRRKMKDVTKIGNKMAELTGQRFATFLVLNLLVVLIFTYTEYDTTNASTMVLLHGQTTTMPPSAAVDLMTFKAVDTARRSAIPLLFEFRASSSQYKTNYTYIFKHKEHNLRKEEIQNITVTNAIGTCTGLFNEQAKAHMAAIIEIILVFFFVLVWFFGVAAFAGPIAALVIMPIERAMNLTRQLVSDPLGYRTTLQYKIFLSDTDIIYSKSGWRREILKGMETEFLMSTIDRIGSLMKVGFGSAGAQIIRNNFKKGQSKDILQLSSQGSIVSCIFMFCDIRGFTDATECLQEEIFVFTNRVAGVVHSICNSYAGAANKNVGDAFLVSWKLDDESKPTKHQADKALLSAVKILIALHHNDYYVSTMSDHARAALLDNLKSRPGPTVQVGFGLHAGQAVEGAIGSARKIDATYVSTAVDFSEHLESTTKRYKVPLLMSNDFHRLLSITNRRRCRKIDQVKFDKENDDFLEEDMYSQGNLVLYFTYDIHVDALWEDLEIDDSELDGLSDNDNMTTISMSKRKIQSMRLNRSSIKNLAESMTKRSTSFRSGVGGGGDDKNLDITAMLGAAPAMFGAAAAKAGALPNDLFGPFRDETKTNNDKEKSVSSTRKKRPELVLPTGPALYSENIWLQADMRRIRKRYTTENANFFSTYNKGLQKYYAKEWDEAKFCFESILNCFEDGPSRYFLNEMENCNGVPPTNFKAYGKP